MNGDTYFEVKLNKLLKTVSGKNVDCCFSLFRSSEKGRYMNMTVDKNGVINSLRSDDAHFEGLVNGGVYLMRQELLMSDQLIPGAKYSLENDIFPLALKGNKKLIGVPFLGKFIDIGIPKDYIKASEILGS